MIRLITFFLIYSSVFIHAQPELSPMFQTELQKVLDEYYETNAIQGITAAIKFKSDGYFQGVAGFSHEEVAMDTSFLVGIGSNTKLFTSTLSILLSSKGFFDLDEPISKWLEPIQYVDPNVTTRQLLQHNSGINDFIGNLEIYPTQILNDPTKVWTPEETLSYIFEPITTPNDGIYYSNANYILAGMVIEAATGLKYHDLVRDSIITPLGLQDIFFEGFEEVEGEIAHPFLFGGDYSTTPRIALGTTTWAAGCMISRPITLSKWYDTMFNGNFLTDEQFASLADFVEWPDDDEGKEMGLGLYRITTEDATYFGHGGRTIGYASYTLYDTDCGHSISVVVNQFFADPLTLALRLAEKACELSKTSTVSDTYFDGVQVYPNPASDFITIAGSLRLDLYDLSGRLVLTTNESEYISVGHLLPGVYFAKIQTASQTFSKKIILSR